MGFYCNLCHFVTKSGIHTVLSRNFCNNLRAFMWRKIEPKGTFVEKKWQIWGLFHIYLLILIQREKIGKCLVGPGALPRYNQLFIDWVLGRQPFIVYRHDLHDMFSGLYVLTEAEGFPLFPFSFIRGGGSQMILVLSAEVVKFHSRNRLTKTPEAGIKSIFLGKNLVSSSGNIE